MASMLETPSRVWRRIQAGVGEDMPSLPSLSGFHDSNDVTSESHESVEENMDLSLPITSTPALSNHTVTSTVRAPSSASSTARFANSIASRSSKSALSASRASATQPVTHDSFDISSIPSLPDDCLHDRSGSSIRSSDQGLDEGFSRRGAQDVIPGVDVEEDMDLSDALQSVSRPGSPAEENGVTPSRKYDYSISLRTEKRPSPFDRMRHVSIRRPLSRNARTPSLTHTSPSSASSSSPHSTPRSGISLSYVQAASTSPSPAAIPLPRSATASPFLPSQIPLPPSNNASPAQEQPYEDETETDAFTSEADGEHPYEPTDVVNPEDPSETDLEDQREPTFSSEGAPTPVSRGLLSPAQLTAVPSSPAPSVVFTPTPVFHARPRARFSSPVVTPKPRLFHHPAPQEPDEDLPEASHGSHVQADEQDDLATPHAPHKVDFLLNVVNSTARPRLNHLTPHPHRPPAEHATAAAVTPGVNLRAALAGVTPRPQARRQLSQPAPQTWAPSESEASGSEAGTQSPYDHNSDRASFVSTSSSQDLTSHARANASFDPVMGLGERGQGVDRFNQGKLNNYLFGLNRELVRENHTLMQRLNEYEEKYGQSPTAQPSPQTQSSSSSRRLSAGSRRVSMGPQLGDVAEDAEEKAALEEMVESLKEELHRCVYDKDKAEAVLLAEQTERARDKERYKERMGEVERGVERIVRELEQKTEEAVQAAKAAEEEKRTAVKDAEKQLAVVVVEREVLAERLKKAEEALRSGKDLGSEINVSNQRIAQLTGDLKNAATHSKELETELEQADQKIDQLETELQDEKHATAELKSELRSKAAEIAASKERSRDLEDDLHKTQEALRDSKAYISQLDADAGDAVERIQALEEELAAAQEKLVSMEVHADEDNDEIERLTSETERATELARQMEEALEAAESRMLADEQEAVALKAKVTSLERALEREQEKSKSQVGPTHSELARDVQAEIDALEQELDDTHKENGRLRTLLGQSPSRSAIDKAKDAKIELLEKEKEDLMERIKSLKSATYASTPSKIGNTSGISPMHRHILSMGMKSPKTPGGPLRELSWLQSTMHDPSVSPLVEEIHRLQHELDRANESIDDKLDRLEDAGLGVVGLTKELEDARVKIVGLEDEIARLSRKEDRRSRRLQRARCKKCCTKIDWFAFERLADADESSILSMGDMSLASEPPTPPTKTSEALRRDLAKVNNELTSMKQTWELEKDKLLGENAVLQDTANRLNSEVRSAKSEMLKFVQAERAGEKARGDVKSDLERARRTIESLETELKSERSRLRSLATEQSRAQREKEEVALQLRRTETDMADVKQYLLDVKQENHELETELRATSTAEQKARLLESKVTENIGTIDQLRQERSLLAHNHKELQRRYTQLSEGMNKLREQHAASQTSHDSRRHKLDMQLLEVEELRRALSTREEELAQVESERHRMAAEKSDVARTVAALEADLRRVRKEAEAIGRDLKTLRMQKDRLEEERKKQEAKADRAQKQAQSQIRVLKEELDTQHHKTKAVAKQLKDHVCPTTDASQLVAIKLQHNNECKGLIVQIKYLKAKFFRESALRSDVSFQKQYLLTLLARSERTEQKILTAIARIGFPAAELPSAAPHKQTFRSAVHSVIFVLRVGRAAESWRQQCASKEAIAAALQEVRQRRATKSNGN